jgi:hypothetical protein
MMPVHMRDGLDFKKHDHYPAVHDAGWKPLTEPLLLYVAECARTIDDIVAWGRAQGHTGALIRHMLAWLSFKNIVHYSPRSLRWQRGPEPQSDIV